MFMFIVHQAPNHTHSSNHILFLETSADVSSIFSMTDLLLISELFILFITDIPIASQGSTACSRSLCYPLAVFLAHRPLPPDPLWPMALLYYLSLVFLSFSDSLSTSVSWEDFIMLCSDSKVHR